MACQYAPDEFDRRDVELGFIDRENIDSILDFAFTTAEEIGVDDLQREFF
ncbi:MAG: hypothetical protein ABEJ99_05650 [Candidatus Nanohaloarchaea archaeon]